MMNLQLFADAPTAVSGKKIVYLYRIMSEAAKADGVTLAFTTENGRTKSKDADSTITKDGSIRTPSESETEITATSVLTKGDTLIEKLEKAMDDDAIIEIWEANLDEPIAESANQFKGMYFQGYLTEIEKTSNAEDNVEISLTFGINGKGASGNVTVSDANQATAAYVFKDTTKTGA